MRLEVLRGLPELPATESALALAGALMADGAVPEKARTDAAHIAVAAVHEMDFLVTWNCRHLANANKFGHIRRVNALLGLFVPALVTPLELLGGSDETESE